MKRIVISLIAVCLAATAFAQHPQNPQRPPQNPQQHQQQPPQGPATMKAAPQQQDLKNGPQGKQPALKKVYDENIDPLKQIDQAVAQAKREGKFVICQLGGNWCIWCLRFADYISKDRDIMKLIDENYVYIHVSYNPKQARSKDKATADKAKKLLKRLNYAGRFGYPVFIVLNQKGHVIHIQESGYLEEGQSYDKDKVLRFFKNWTPTAVTKL